MSLSERLQRARTQQLIEAGLLASEHALKPEEVDEPGAPDASDTQRAGLDETAANTGLFAPISPIKMEVQPTGLHVVAEAPQDLGELRTADGASFCPNCNGPARLDMVDLVGHTMHYTCATCGAMWQTHKPVSAS